MDRNDILEGWTNARKGLHRWLDEQDRLFEAMAKTTAPVILAPTKPSPGVQAVEPPDVVALPLEADLSRFYGEAVPEPDFLDWFNFPVDDVVLYTRDGAALSDHTGDAFDDHKVHKVLVESLQDALATIYATLGAERFYREGWHVYGGAFNYRPRKAGTSLSVHAWGAAVDFNPNENPLYSDRTTFSIEAVEIMEAFGWLWGPRAWGMPGFENPKHPGQYFDPMHFQAAIPSCIAGSYYATKGWPKNLRRWSPKS